MKKLKKVLELAIVFAVVASVQAMKEKCVPIPKKTTEPAPNPAPPVNISDNPEINTLTLTEEVIRFTEDVKKILMIAEIVDSNGQVPAEYITFEKYQEIKSLISKYDELKSLADKLQKDDQLGTINKLLEGLDKAKTLLEEILKVFEASPCDICPDEVKYIFDDLKLRSESFFPPSKMSAESLISDYKRLKEIFQGNNYRNACTACLDFESLEENFSWRLIHSGDDLFYCNVLEPCKENIDQFLKEFKDLKIVLDSIDDLQENDHKNILKRVQKFENQFNLKKKVYERCGCGGRIDEYDIGPAAKRLKHQIVEKSCVVCPSSVKDSFKRIQNQLANFQTQKDNAKFISKLPSQNSAIQLENDLNDHVINKFTQNPSCETCLDHHTLRGDLNYLKSAINDRHEKCDYYECPEFNSMVEKLSGFGELVFDSPRTNYELAMKLNETLPIRKQIDIQMNGGINVDGFCECKSFPSLTEFDERLEYLYWLYEGIEEVFDQCTICPVESVKTFTEISKKVPNWDRVPLYIYLEMSGNFRKRDYDTELFYLQRYYNGLMMALDSLPNPSPCKTCSDQLRYDYQSQAEKVKETMNQTKCSSTCSLNFDDFLIQYEDLKLKLQEIDQLNLSELESLFGHVQNFKEEYKSKKEMDDVCKCGKIDEYNFDAVETRVKDCVVCPSGVKDSYKRLQSQLNALLEQKGNAKFISELPSQYSAIELENDFDDQVINQFTEYPSCEICLKDYDNLRSEIGGLKGRINIWHEQCDYYECPEFEPLFEKMWEYFQEFIYSSRTNYELAVKMNESLAIRNQIKIQMNGGVNVDGFCECKNFPLLKSYDESVEYFFTEHDGLKEVFDQCTICPVESVKIFTNISEKIPHWDKSSIYPLEKVLESNAADFESYVNSLQDYYNGLMMALDSLPNPSPCKTCSDQLSYEYQSQAEKIMEMMNQIKCSVSSTCSSNIDDFLIQYEDLKLKLQRIDQLNLSELESLLGQVQNFTEEYKSKKEMDDVCRCGRIDEYDFEAAEKRLKDQIVEKSCAVCPTNVKDSFKRIESQLANFQTQKDNAKFISELPSQNSAIQLENDLDDQVINKFTQNPSCETCLDHYTLRADIDTLKGGIRIRHEMCDYYECPEFDSMVERMPGFGEDVLNSPRTNYEVAMQLNVTLATRKQIDIQMNGGINVDGYCECGSFPSLKEFDERLKSLYAIFEGINDVFDQCTICPVESVKTFTEISKKIPDWDRVYFDWTFFEMSLSEVKMRENLEGRDYTEQLSYLQDYHNGLMMALDSLTNPSPCKTCSDQLRYNYQTKAEMVVEMMTQLKCLASSTCSTNIDDFLRQFNDLKLNLQRIEQLKSSELKNLLRRVQNFTEEYKLKKNENDLCHCGRIDEYDFDAAESRFNCSACPSSVKDSFKRFQNELPTLIAQRDNAKSITELPSTRNLESDFYDQVTYELKKNPSCEICLDYHTLEENIGNLTRDVLKRNNLCDDECGLLKSLKNFENYPVIFQTNLEIAMELNKSLTSRKQIIFSEFCECSFSEFDRDVERFYEKNEGVKEVLNQCSICPMESIYKFKEISQKIPEWHWTFFEHIFDEMSRSKVIIRENPKWSDYYTEDFNYMQDYYNALLKARDSLPNPSPCKTCSDQLRYDYQSQAEMVMEMMNQMKRANLVTSD